MALGAGTSGVRLQFACARLPKKTDSVALRFSVFEVHKILGICSLAALSAFWIVIGKVVRSRFNFVGSINWTDG